jgi:hypothetical protein
MALNGKENCEMSMQGFTISSGAEKTGAQAP